MVMMSLILSPMQAVSKIMRCTQNITKFLPMLNRSTNNRFIITTKHTKIVLHSNKAQQHHWIFHFKETSIQFNFKATAHESRTKLY